MGLIRQRSGIGAAICDNTVQVIEALLQKHVSGYRSCGKNTYMCKKRENKRITIATYDVHQHAQNMPGLSSNVKMIGLLSTITSLW